ncbi:hypothetical protein [Streptomyces sp. NPDC007905]
MVQVSVFPSSYLTENLFPPRPPRSNLPDRSVETVPELDPE